MNRKMKRCKLIRKDQGFSICQIEIILLSKSEIYVTNRRTSNQNTTQNIEILYATKGETKLNDHAYYMFSSQFN